MYVVTARSRCDGTSMVVAVCKNQEKAWEMQGKLEALSCDLEVWCSGPFELGAFPGKEDLPTISGPYDVEGTGDD